MLHIDDRERISYYQSLLGEPRPPDLGGLDVRDRRLLLMQHFSLWGRNESPEGLANGLERLWAEPARREELRTVLDTRLHHVTSTKEGHTPLHVHGTCSLFEALAAFGVENPGSVRRGVKWVEEVVVGE